MRVCFGFVAYNKYGGHDWSHICASSFRKVFGKDMPLFVVDHNHIQQERDLLSRKGAVLLENDRGKKRHGIGLDVIVDHAKAEGYDILVVIEPDCLITSDIWFKHLITAIADGYHMAGVLVLNHGPIHPCGTAWRIKEIKHTFEAVPKGTEMLDDEYPKVMKYDKLREEPWHLTGWDVGLKNWYCAAARGLAKAVPSDGFRHFWGSSWRSPLELIKVWNYDPELIKAFALPSITLL